ncbi:MAG: hypothetical protein JWM74_924 [Myxococcaceae bacterium]|nr:hypothetical protein [Myxococcaceae bacterium]
MRYLYGDSTPSPLESNFLELLRDALDFSVYVLSADERMRQSEQRLVALHARYDATVSEIGAFSEIVQATIKDAPHGEAGSPLARCADRVAFLVGDTEKRAVAEERAIVEAAAAAAEVEENAERDGCLSALEKFLVAHLPPGTTSVRHLTARATGGYDATSTGKTEIGLAWKFEMSAPASAVFSQSARIERLLPHLEVQAPELSGFFKKALKVKAQRLDKMAVTEVIDDGREVTLRLREQGAAHGFDFEVDLGGATVSAVRVGGSKEDPGGPFDVDPADVPKLVELAKIVHVGVLELERARLVEATFDDEPFQQQEVFADVVERLVDALSPVVRDISNHSLAPTELILRRLLANDRREEIFVAKSTLWEKLAPLDPKARAIFAPLALGVDPARPAVASIPSERPAAAEEEADEDEEDEEDESDEEEDDDDDEDEDEDEAPEQEVIPRAEIAASRPPPPPSLAPPAQPSVKPEASSAADAPPDAAPAEAPHADASHADAPSEAPQRNVVLIGRLKTILSLAKQGKSDEAYDEYGALFADPVFGEYRAEDQRQALKLMVHAKQAPALTTTVRDAHRIAAERARAMIERFDDPSDHEILGLCQLVLDDPAAAASSFARGLELERARNPQSELCGTLLRRVSEL